MTDNYSGFSLIEMAIVLIILGILATVVIPPLVFSVKYEKRAENKDALNALKLSVIGYAKAKGELPSSLGSAVGATKDIWGREYEYKNALNDTICDATANDGFVLIVDDDNATNVAFALASQSRLNGAGDNAQYNLVSWDFSGAGHDDIYEFVTLSQLKYLVCSSSDGGSDTDNSTGDDTISLYYDSFDDDSLMQDAIYTQQNHAWTVSNGTLNAEDANYFVTGNSTWSNCTVSVDVIMDRESTDGGSGGAALLYRAELAGWYPIGYGFQIDPGKGNMFVLRKYTGSGETVLWEMSYADDDWVDTYGTFNVSEQHNIKVKVSGNDHTLYIDNIELHTYTDITTPIYSSGQVGLRFWGGYSVTFDNLRVTEN